MTIKINMRTLLSTLLMALIITSAAAQNSDYVISETNVEYLQKFAEEHEKKASEEKARAIRFCEENGYPITMTTAQGQFAEVIGFDENGLLKYAITNNWSAARTISADQVQSYGLVGYNLNGRGFTAGVWDGGRARGSHQEFSGRLTYGDNNSNFVTHATHVSGSIIAQGIRSEARGMAPEGNVVSYDWNSPLSEMASEAAQGLLVSNHSWGFVNGWAFGNYSGNNGWHWFGDVNISATEDYAFGRYDVNAQAWDDLAVNAPFFTIVKSAGNERNDSGPSPGGGHYARNASGAWELSTTTRQPDGEFDCQANMTLSKNMLSVGAVNAIPQGYGNPSQVVPAGFSSYGPSDDGRIKPDLVANGVGLLSATAGSNTAYGNSSGTSMSAPTITGAILQLQEHYNNVNSGGTMRSETVRALLIHNCDEAGLGTGPDYAFGWGLANIENSARAITNNGKRSIVEQSQINEGQEITYQVYSDGNRPLKATIAWLDPAGTPGPLAVDDRGIILVNDLDLRIISPSDTTFPWKLDPDNPLSPATKGDNLVDNVEVVEIPNPQAGVYTITINHKDSLQGGFQSYGIIVTGIKTADSSNFCNPVTKYNSYYGQFSDGSNRIDPYTIDQDCSWKINTKPGSTIELRFNYFDLQPLSDYVRVYDGPDANYPVLATFSGANTPPVVTSSTNDMYVEFHSDGNDLGNKGFLASYSASYCPSFHNAPNVVFTGSTFGDSCDRIIRFFRNASNFDSLFIDYGDGNTSNTSSLIHNYTYANGGVYDVTVIAYGKCLINDTAKAQITVPCQITSLDDNLDQNLSIYPNPSEGMIYIESDELQIESLEILDINGKSVIQKTGNSREIDISELSNGYYLLKVNSTSGILVKRIFKQ